MRRVGALALAVAVSLAGGCSRDAGRGGPEGAAEDARDLVAQGDYDGALARLGGATDPESLYLLGLAWAGKAEAASRPSDGRLGREEQQALVFLEKAIAARPDHAGAQLAIAELLAPHVPSPGAPAGQPSPSVPPPPVSAERVLAAYGAAIQADPADKVSVEALIRFATRMDRPREASAAYQELLKRDRENPDLLVRFGDFLTGPGGDPEAALGVYAQALIWRPDDSETQLKMASVHLDAARAHVERREFVAAEARLREARKHVVVAGSPQAAELRELERMLADVSGRR